MTNCDEILSGDAAETVVARGPPDTPDENRAMGASLEKQGCKAPDSVVYGGVQSRCPGLLPGVLGLLGRARARRAPGNRLLELVTIG